MTWPPRALVIWFLRACLNKIAFAWPAQAARTLEQNDNKVIARTQEVDTYCPGELPPLLLSFDISHSGFGANLYHYISALVLAAEAKMELGDAPVWFQLKPKTQVPSHADIRSAFSPDSLSLYSNATRVVVLDQPSLAAVDICFGKQVWFGQDYNAERLALEKSHSHASRVASLLRSAVYNVPNNRCDPMESHVSPSEGSWRCMQPAYCRTTMNADKAYGQKALFDHMEMKAHNFREFPRMIRSIYRAAQCQRGSNSTSQVPILHVSVTMITPVASGPLAHAYGFFPESASRISTLLSVATQDGLGNNSMIHHCAYWYRPGKQTSIMERLEQPWDNMFKDVAHITEQHNLSCVVVNSLETKSTGFRVKGRNPRAVQLSTSRIGAVQFHIAPMLSNTQHLRWGLACPLFVTEAGSHGVDWLLTKRANNTKSTSVIFRGAFGVVDPGTKSMTAGKIRRSINVPPDQGPLVCHRRSCVGCAFYRGECIRSTSIVLGPDYRDQCVLTPGKYRPAANTFLPGGFMQMMEKSIWPLKTCRIWRPDNGTYRLGGLN